MQLQDVSSQLKAPFSAAELKLLPKSVNRDRGQALALPYIDARAVADRLDAVVGPDNWQDSYEVITVAARDVVQMCVKCRLTVLGITHESIGEPGNTPGEEAFKSAESDSFKRCSTKFGIGRYIYSLPKRWLAFDGKKFTETYPMPGSRDKTTPIDTARRQRAQAGTGREETADSYSN